MKRPTVAGRGWLPAIVALLALGAAWPAAAQQQDTADTTAATTTTSAPTDSIVSAAVNVGGSIAALELGLSDGRTVQLELAGGNVRADGESIGNYDEGDALDRSWRALLEDAAMASTAELPAVLRAWEPPAGEAAGSDLDARLEQALAGVGGRMLPTTTRTAASTEDSIDKLLAEIEELQQHRVIIHDDDDDLVEAFLHDVAQGFGMFFTTLVWLGVLFGLGAGLLFFGNGRLERLATTAREEPVRSGLIGLAGAFLAIPVYVLVIIALAISILGIPLLIAWAPVFPAVFMIAGFVGYLAVAYAAGDALVTGRLAHRKSFQDAGPFKRIAVGLALLLTPFFLAGLFQVTSVLEWVAALLFVVGVFVTILACAVGFGAVLVRGRDALDRQRERRAAARRARLEEKNQTVEEGTNA